MSKFTFALVRPTTPICFARQLLDGGDLAFFEPPPGTHSTAKFFRR